MEEDSSEWDSPWCTACQSFEERHPDISGRLLQDKARSIYITKEWGSKALPFKDDEGNRLFVRSPLNDRDEVSTRENYIELLQTKGWVLGCRGEVVARPVKRYSTAAGKEVCLRHIIGGAHLIEAVYEAEERFPENVQVRRAITHGVPQVCDIDERTPPDVETSAPLSLVPPQSPLSHLAAPRSRRATCD